MRPKRQRDGRALRLGLLAAVALTLSVAACSGVDDAVGGLVLKPDTTRQEQLRAVFDTYRIELGQDFRGLVISNLGDAYLDAQLDGRRVAVTLPPGRRFRQTTILRVSERPSLLIESEDGRALARLTFSRLGALERWGGLFDASAAEAPTDYDRLAAKILVEGPEAFARRANQSALRLQSARGEPGRLALSSLTEISDADRNKQIVSIWDSVARIGAWTLSLRSSDASGVAEEEAWALHRAVMIGLFVEPPQTADPAAAPAL